MNIKFLKMFLTILTLAVTMIYVKIVFCASNEYASLASPGEVMLPDVSVVDGRITLDLRDIEIKDALKFLATKADLNIIPTSEVAGRVTLMVKDAPIDDIFEIVIRSNALAYEKIGSIYNVMTEKEYKARYGRNFDDIRKVKVFRLKYVVPDQAYNIANSMKTAIGKVLVEPESGTLMVLDTPEAVGEIENMLQSLEKKSNISIFTLKYAKAEEVAKQLKTQLDLKNVGSVKADDRTNQVIVQTLPERMADIEKIIQKLDQKTKEVLIDARIIQVKLTDHLSEGVQWEGLFQLSKKYGTTYLGSYPLSSVASETDDWRSRRQVISDTGYVGSYPFSGTTSDLSAGTKKTASEEMHLGVVGKNDFDVLINYLKTLGDVKILSNPKLAVINNQEARIHVGERQAYITTSTTAGQTTTTVAENVTFLDVGLQLAITPTINDEGYVTLNIKPELSSVIGSLITAANNAIPIVDTSTAQTTVMVKDGSTIAVAGLRREEHSISAERFPVLSKIPVFGMLFKSGTDLSSRTELLIMLTPHIIEGDELTTGDIREFGGKPDEEFQEYKPITYESDLAEHESRIKTFEKSYQEYPEVKAEEEYYPNIKPIKDE
ncbi:MAG: hypothetical protein HY810_01730 [Candidatus Omnitrophica bacterium]|nr:hypothetical protein [Candidatus Omnitrophota bacterium]